MLFDYKYTDPKNIKPNDMEKYRGQLDLYSKAIEKRFGTAPREKYLVFLPEIELMSV